MRFIKEFTLILAVSFAGEVLRHLIPLPIPAGVYGIVILFTLLATKIVPLGAVERTGDFLIKIMPVMFIPGAVGILESWGSIKGSVAAYIVIAVVSTVAVMGVSGIVTDLVIRHGGKKE